jgi:hypothetical protein
LKDSSAAARFLKASLELNPSSDTAGAAREALEKLAPTSAEARNSN